MNRCDLSGSSTSVGNSISRTRNVPTRSRRFFYPNLQKKKIYVPEWGCFISFRISLSVLRNIRKKGVVAVVQDACDKGTISPSLYRRVKPYLKSNG